MKYSNDVNWIVSLLPTISSKMRTSHEITNFYYNLVDSYQDRVENEIGHGLNVV